ncbi:hypothetical protein [Aestuariispira insulae]|uniref:AAA domain-containing protein n=1 Tax=Aestuariispira insulae TaxID=1461337 RepID=A0A3D9HWE0_9PROT|nr:hypothetical protein [Aestuariispira insulae]RED53236.1 hypothetical protein DFP90_10118 [Aestuariispira insulae]
MPLSGEEIVIFTGLTGAGKTTAVSLFLEMMNKDAVLLPNRRELTDRLIIPEFANGPVQDRISRFEITGRFRNAHPGGMAEILAGLSIHPNLHGRIFLFDNLRGRNEVDHALHQFGNATFVHVSAPLQVRLHRLLTRLDPFDQVKDRVANSEGLAERLRQSMPRQAVQGIMEKVACNLYDATEVVDKLDILEKEAENYSDQDCLELLQSNAKSRQVIYRTDEETPEDFAIRLRLCLGI